MSELEEDVYKNKPVSCLHVVNRYLVTMAILVMVMV